MAQDRVGFLDFARLVIDALEAADVTYLIGGRGCSMGLMRRFIREVSPFLFFIGLVLLIFALGFAIVGGVSIALGHVLMRFFPFSLFEATILSFVFAAVAVYLVVRIVAAIAPPFHSTELTEADSEDEDTIRDYTLIPTSRFYSTNRERTWEAWLRADLANDIYVAFQDEPRAVSNLNQSQAQELVIRLSDLAIAILKRKSSGSRRLAITVSALRRELRKSGQQAYDDDILLLALEAINMNFDFHYPILIDLIRRKSWNEPSGAPADN